MAEAGNPGVVTIATNMAGRGTDIKLSEEVKASGGLAIVEPNGTIPVVWTVSSADALDAREIPEAHSFMSPWRTTSCVFLAPTE